VAGVLVYGRHLAPPGPASAVHCRAMRAHRPRSVSIGSPPGSFRVGIAARRQPPLHAPCPLRDTASSSGWPASIYSRHSTTGAPSNFAVLSAAKDRSCVNPLARTARGNQAFGASGQSTTSAASSARTAGVLASAWRPCALCGADLCLLPRANKKARARSASSDCVIGAMLSNNRSWRFGFPAAFNHLSSWCLCLSSTGAPVRLS